MQGLHKITLTLETIYPGSTQDRLSVVPPLFCFSTCQLEAKKTGGCSQVFAETGGMGVGIRQCEDRSSNPHPANDHWVFVCKSGAPVLTFRHCHEDEKRQPMKREEPWHTPPGTEYTPASFHVVCGQEAAEGVHFSFPPCCAVGLCPLLVDALLHTGSLRPTSNPQKRTCPDSIRK